MYKEKEFLNANNYRKSGGGGERGTKWTKNL